MRAGLQLRASRDGRLLPATPRRGSRLAATCRPPSSRPPAGGQRRRFTTSDAKGLFSSVEEVMTQRTLGNYSVAVPSRLLLLPPKISVMFYRCRPRGEHTGGHAHPQLQTCVTSKQHAISHAKFDEPQYMFRVRVGAPCVVPQNS
jgi:hypothetical protein